jgi:hypothetical protein
MPTVTVTPVSVLEQFLHSFQASQLQRTSSYWDNGSSFNTVPIFEPDRYYDITQITPFYIGGPVSGMMATHSGRHRGLPAGRNTVFLCPTSTVSLFSIGYLCHGDFATAYQNGSSLCVTLSDGTVLDSSITASNQLSPVTASLLTSNRSAPNVCGPDTFISSLNRSIKPSKVFESALIDEATAYINGIHYTPEQIARANEVESLHQVHAHVSDEALGYALSHGIITTRLRCTNMMS